MNFTSEKQLLKIIKYLPTIFLIAISLIIISFLYIENLQTFNNQKEQIQNNYIAKSKEIITERVNNTYNYILNMQQTTEKELKKSLKEEMNKAYSIAYSIYENNKDTKSEEDIKKLIKDAIRPIRFNNGRGYFFIHDKNIFANTMHPIMPHLEGRNSYNVKDAKGEYIIRQMHSELRKSDETSFEWYWYKPGDKKTQHKKIGYIRNFEPYNWFIGTGEYVKDFEKQVQKKVLENIHTTTYDKYGYIFVIRYDGVVLNYFNNDLQNKNALEIPKLKEQTQRIIDYAKDKKAGFISYDKIPNPQDNIASRKTSYIKAVDNWQWVIGTGFYENDVNAQIQMKKDELDSSILKHMQNTIIISIVITLVLLILSLYLAKVISKKFKTYKKEIDSHLKDKVKQENILAQQAKMAAMGEMIGNIAHQWRQPLSSITSSATSMVVQKEMNLLEDKALIEGLKEINKKSQYLSATIDDFRNFFNSNKHKSTFNLRGSIKETLSILDSPLKHKDITVVEDIENLDITNYKNEFMQVIINILNNSKDALSHKHSNKFILINAYQKDSNLILEIKDSGGGINEDIIDKIFDPYFTTKHQFQGTGIGLYMSNEIITKHMKGKIEASNEEFLYENHILFGAKLKVTIPIS